MEAQFPVLAPIQFVPSHLGSADNQSRNPGDAVRRLAVIGAMLLGATTLGATTLGPINPAAAASTPAPFLYAEVAVGVAPLGVAVNPTGTKAYVANILSGTVTAINTGTLTSTSITGLSGPFGLAVSPDGDELYVSQNGVSPYGSGTTVNVIDTSTNASLATVTVGTGPQGIAFTPDGAKAYVANYGDGTGTPGYTVTVINTSTRSTSTITLATGSGAYAVAVSPTGSRAYVANSADNTVSVINTSDDTVAGVVTGLNSPKGVAVSSDGSKVFVTNSGNNTVSVIDTSTNTISGTVSVGTSPIGITVDPTGRYVYVANNGTNTMSVIDSTSNTVIATLSDFGTQPFGLASSPDGARVYASMNGSGRTAVIDTGMEVTCSYSHSWPGGSGTNSNPYQVADSDDLEAVGHCLDSAFVQTQDISLSGTWTPIGTAAASFTGNYNGGGHTISGLAISDASVATGEPVGLFGRSFMATISDVTLANVDINVTHDNTGALVGSCEACTIDGVEVSGTVTSTGEFVGGLSGLSQQGSLTTASSSVATSGTTHVGGLVGVADGPTITNASASGDVAGAVSVGGLVGAAHGSAIVSRTSASGAVAGDDRVGGLVGTLGSRDAPTPGDWASLTTSFATGNVRATGSPAGQAGGLVGVLWQADSDHPITDSYATGSVTGTSIAGGFLGDINPTDGSVVRSYSTGAVSVGAGGDIGGFTGWTPVVIADTFVLNAWNTGTSGTEFGLGGEGGTHTPMNVDDVTGLTSTQMRYSANFPGWNFTTTWGYDCQRSVFPVLRWAVPTATATSCPPSSPTPGPGGGTPTPETSSPAGSAAPQPVATGAPSVPAGQARGTIGGIEVPVTITPRKRGEGVAIDLDSMRFTMRSATSNGRRVPLQPNGSLILARSGPLPVTGTGLDPDSAVTQTLYSNPSVLGNAQVNTRGEFTSRVTVPATTPLGAHTLVLSGETPSGLPFQLEVGVTVATPAVALGANPVITTLPAKPSPGQTLTVRGIGIQSSCRVSFQVGQKVVRAQSTPQGRVTAQITLPANTSRLVTTVSGRGCAPISLTQKIKVRSAR